MSRRQLCPSRLKVTATLALGFALVYGSGCSTMNTARPLEAEATAASVTAGGPIAEIPNVGALPIPNITAELRHGMGEGWDLHAGFHTVATVFGILGIHLGGSYLLLEEEGLRPALSAGGRLFGFTNRLDSRKSAEANADWLLAQLEINASWMVKGQLLYVGVAEYLDPGAPALLWTPFVGAELRHEQDLRPQLELRYLAPHRDQSYAVVDWVAPGNHGGIIVTLGLSYHWGRASQRRAPPASSARRPGEPS